MRIPKTLSRSSQQGMALLIALVVLIVVSLLGAAALRSSAFQSKISVNAQAAQIAFQADQASLLAVEAQAVAQVRGGILPSNAAHIFNIAFNNPNNAVVVTRTLAGVINVDPNGPARVETNGGWGNSFAAQAPVVWGQAQSYALVSYMPSQMDAPEDIDGFGIDPATERTTYVRRRVYVESNSTVSRVGMTSRQVNVYSVFAPGG